MDWKFKACLCSRKVFFMSMAASENPSLLSLPSVHRGRDQLPALSLLLALSPWCVWGGGGGGLVVPTDTTRCGLKTSSWPWCLLTPSGRGAPMERWEVTPLWQCLPSLPWWW